MLKRFATMSVVVILGVSLSLLSISCAKKVVKKEEEVTKLKPVAKPKPPPTKEPSEPKPSPAPVITEKPAPTPTVPKRLTAEQREWERAARAFSNLDIYFDFDKYNLKPRARELLADKALFMKKYPRVKVLIEGHCDERGTNEYNLALGERRANAAFQYLAKLGISPKRMATISYGEERPLDPRHNEEAWAKNRRAHFMITAH